MKIRFLIVLCMAVMFVGCATHLPYIAPMQLSVPQQEIIDIIANMGQEILLFDYSLGEAFNDIEVRGEIFRYGESLGSMGGLSIYKSEGFGDGRLAIYVRHCRHNNEFQYVIYSEGGTFTSTAWTHSRETVGRMFGQIDEAVSITDGQEIIIYISKFTTDYSMPVFNDFQYYLQPEALAGYTYVHLIKARFSQRG